MLFRRHRPMHRTVGISPGEGSGREPPPRQKEPYSPSTAAPAQERGFSWKEPGKGAAGGATLDTILLHSMHCSPLSPTPPALRAPPPPRGGGSAGDSPGKACPGAGPDPILRRRHLMHRKGHIQGGDPGYRPPTSPSLPASPLRQAARPYRHVGRSAGSARERQIIQVEYHSLVLFPVKNQLRAHLWGDPGDL